MLFPMAKLKVLYTSRSVFFGAKAYIKYFEQRKKCYNAVDWSSNDAINFWHYIIEKQLVKYYIAEEMFFKTSLICSLFPFSKEEKNSL